MCRSTLSHLGQGDLVVGKLPHNTMLKLIECNAVAAFHNILRESGFSHAQAWLSSQGLDLVEPVHVCLDSDNIDSRTIVVSMDNPHSVLDVLRYMREFW